MTVGMGAELASDLDRSLAELLPVRVALELQESGETSNPELLRALLRLGLLEVAIPESHGGLGLGVADLAELWFVAGRHLLPMAIREQSLVLLPLLTTASDDPRIARHIDRLRSGDASGGGQVFVDDPPEDGVVSASCGADADVLFLLGPRRAVVYVEPVLVPPLRSGAVGDGLARFTLAGAHPLLSFGPDIAHPIWSQWNVAVMAEIAGCAARVLELSVAYAKARQQFGRAIAEFQAVSHMLADMRTELDASKAVIARMIAGGEGAEGDWLLSLGRYVVPSAARTVCELGIQVHGGTGFTWEYGLHLFYRRVLHLQTVLGGADRTALALGRLYLEQMRGNAGA